MDKDILPKYPTSEMTYKNLREVIGQGVGAASMRWEDPGGAGTFQSERAIALRDEIMRAAEQFAEHQIMEHNRNQREKTDG